MPKRESRKKLFADMLGELPVEEHPDVLEFVLSLMTNGVTQYELPAIPNSELLLAELKRNIENNVESEPEMPRPTPGECYGLALHVFEILTPPEQRLALFQLTIKLQNMRHPGLEEALYEKVSTPLSKQLLEDYHKLQSAMEVARPLILARDLGHRKKLPDLSALSPEDRESIVHAEERLARSAAIRHTTSMALEDYTGVMMEEDRKALAKLYTRKLNLNAVDILTQGIVTAFVKNYQTAGLVSRYLM